MSNHVVRRAVQCALFASAAAAAAPALSQDSVETVQEIVVTGSRIQRQDYEANSPLTTVSSKDIVAHTDVTLDTFLNTLPQVNPAGTTTSNNPGNGGQSNINLRGLGANRNLVLIDGRRPMFSASNLTVDLNTIPQALVESIEVITGGAGAVYGADAVAGVVNIKTKQDFEGLDVRSGFSNSIESWDSREYQVSAVAGHGFFEDRFHAVLGADFSQRDALYKSQRPFSAVASSTTGAIPEGVARFNPNNGFSQSSVDTVFAQYGAAPGSVPIANSPVGFNLDGTLFGLGVFGRPADVVNFRYPIDISVNKNFFPDVYTFNFDAQNVLVLPLKRRSAIAKFDFEIGAGVEAFAQVGWTGYDSTTALAPTPLPTAQTEAVNGTTANRVHTSLITPGATSCADNQGKPQPCFVSGALVVPVTNPFIPNDLRPLLNSRVGNDPAIVGSGATEPFLMQQRTLSMGLRTSDFENEVKQYMLGFRGELPLVEGWRWEAYIAEGRTDIETIQAGNINAQKLQTVLEAADGGASLCEGGFNPFGRQPVSASCQEFLSIETRLKQELKQRVVQAFASGDVVSLPAGEIGLVVGAELRDVEYVLDPGAAAGAIHGFNPQLPAGGETQFKDAFTELLVPLLSDATLAQSLDLSLGYRYSESSFQSKLVAAQKGDDSNSAYKAELSWQPVQNLRARTSYQRAVRAPNFAELFDGGNLSPQFFDPCTARSDLRNGPDAAAARALCIAGGVPAAGVDAFSPLPNGQITQSTTGNTNLKPEVADTWTLGLVFSSPWEGALSNLRGSIDYYKIEIEDVILAPDVNIFIADCFNYFGNNPSYAVSYASCGNVRRTGGNISSVTGPGPNGVFPNINATQFATDGIDLQLDYGIDMPSLFGQPSQLGLGMFVNYLMSFERKDRANLPTLDYAGTVSYFGQGLGTSFPEFKANLNAIYSVGPVSFDMRVRWIDSMINRAALQFAGESAFTGVPSITYVDLGTSWEFMDGGVLRLGVNNVANKEPPLYSPNVQSGTDPSLYDVVGRRIFGQVSVKF